MTGTASISTETAQFGVAEGSLQLRRSTRMSEEVDKHHLALVDGPQRELKAVIDLVAMNR